MDSKHRRALYQAPEVYDYGKITDHTFTNPGGHVKGCQQNCNLDAFGEQAGNPHSP